MDLSVTQVHNVLRTYQKLVREERVKSILGVGEDRPRWNDRLDISREGRSRLGGERAGNPTQDDLREIPR